MRWVLTIQSQGNFIWFCLKPYTALAGQGSIKLLILLIVGCLYSAVTMLWQRWKCWSTPHEFPVNRRHWHNTGSMLAHRLRCVANNKPTLDKCFLFVGGFLVVCYKDTLMIWTLLSTSDQPTKPKTFPFQSQSNFFLILWVGPLTYFTMISLPHKFL